MYLVPVVDLHMCGATTTRSFILCPRWAMLGIATCMLARSQQKNLVLETADRIPLPPPPPATVPHIHTPVPVVHDVHVGLHVVYIYTEIYLLASSTHAWLHKSAKNALTYMYRRTHSVPVVRRAPVLDLASRSTWLTLDLVDSSTACQMMTWLAGESIESAASS